MEVVASPTLDDDAGRLAPHPIAAVTALTWRVHTDHLREAAPATGRIWKYPAASVERRQCRRSFGLF